MIADPCAVILGERRAHDLLALLAVNLTAGDELAAAIRECPADELDGLCRVLQCRLEGRPVAALEDCAAAG